MSSRFDGEQFTFTQPDGTQFEVRGWGNQYQAVFETLDGYTVVRDPASGYYEYAVPDEDELIPSGVRPGQPPPEQVGARGLRDTPEVARTRAMESGLVRGGARWEKRLALRRAAAREGGNPIAAPPQRTTLGNYIGLVLLVEFPDVPATITQKQVQDFCNEPGYTGFGNHGSVRDYFFDVSGGLLTYTNIVAPYYRAKKNRGYYTNETVPQPVRARELIREALRHWKNQGFDFTDLTLDEQQCAYAVNVFYTGPVVNNWAKGLWPHAHFLAQPYKLADGRFANDYQVTAMGDELRLGTFCHENGHMICDFPDLYDYGGQSQGVGHFCLMGGGNHADQKNPTHIGAYLKFKAGWGNPRTMKPGTFQLKAGANDFLILERSSTEYYIVENRRKAGRDAALPGEGLAIWHVDEVGNQEHEQMTAAQHYECSLIQADGANHLEKKVNNGDASDLFTSATASSFATRWWDGTAGGRELTSIGPAGDVLSLVIK